MVVLCLAPLSLSVFSPEIITFSSSDGDHGLIAVLSPGFFEGVLGGAGVRARRWENVREN